MGERGRNIVRRVFLFTDIEGSTELWERSAVAMRTALREHDEMVSASVTAHGGIVVKSTGDGFIAAFESASAAVAAAAELQRALHDHAWGELDSLRVRVGLHVGEAESRGDDFFGSPLNVAARLMSSAHGGQVVVSEDVRSEADPAASRWGWRDFGLRRLKGVAQPVRVLQLTVDGLPERFPPLRTLDARPAHLPTEHSAFLGRHEELAVLCEYLRNPDGPRVGALVGPGGVGKTRLATKAARILLDEFADGVVLVELAPIATGTAVLGAIARAAGVQVAQGQNLADAMREFFAEKELLLLLDNVEQIEGFSAQLDEMAGLAPRSMILVTSRTNTDSGWQLVVEPLPLPGVGEDPRAADAVALFLDRAQLESVPTSELDSIAEICRTLDGLPLAIELAAAQARRAGVAVVVESIPSLSRSGRALPGRQHTLENTIEWSVQLLPESARKTFLALAAFRGGWDEQAASVICSADAGDLDLLAEHYLIQYGSGSDRYTMFEAVRQFAEARLGDRVHDLRRNHRDYFCETASGLEEELIGPGRRAALDWLNANTPNIQLAVETCVEADEAAPALEMLGAIWVWCFREAPSTALGWAHQLFELPSAVRGRARVRGALGGCGAAWGAGAMDDLSTFASEALDMVRSLGMTGRLLAQSLTWTAMTSPDALELLEAAKDEADRAGDLWWRAFSWFCGGLVFGQSGDLDAAQAWIDEAIQGWRTCGDLYPAGGALMFTGFISAANGEYDRAVAEVTESLSLSVDDGDRKMAATDLMALAGMQRLRGDRGAATDRLVEALLTSRDIGDSGNIAACLEILAAVALDDGRLAEAAYALRAADALIAKGAQPMMMAAMINAAIRAEVEAAISAEEATASPHQLDDLTAGEAVDRALEIVRASA